MAPLRKIRYEKCVVCHCVTKTPVETHINFRKNFICGVGELCDKCFLELYAGGDSITNEAHKRLIDE